MGSMNLDPEWATEPIAIIGLSCRFAGDASSPEHLWDMMSEKRSAWSEVPKSRYGQKGQYHPENGMLSTVCSRNNIFLPERLLTKCANTDEREGSTLYERRRWPF